MIDPPISTPLLPASDMAIPACTQWQQAVARLLVGPSFAAAAREGAGPAAHPTPITLGQHFAGGWLPIRTYYPITSQRFAWRPSDQLSIGLQQHCPSPCQLRLPPCSTAVLFWFTHMTRSSASVNETTGEREMSNGRAVARCYKMQTNLMLTGEMQLTYRQTCLTQSPLSPAVTVRIGTDSALKRRHPSRDQGPCSPPEG